MERRHSTASDSSTDSRQSSTDGLETGRISKTLAPKVAVNPLQFVKVGPCDLYRSAQEQLKKVEEIKKAKKEKKEEAEEWQSNLDNWKSSRRKRQEHIIERVVEVKKLELEEHERNRRRSKTFSEMMEERNARGRKTKLPVWNDEESEDLSDLGLNGKSDDSDRIHEDFERSENGHSSSENGESEKSQVNGEKYPTNNEAEEPHSKSDKSSDNKESSKPPAETEEYTYERAIQSYVNFAETRVKSKSLKSIEDELKDLKKENPPIPAKPKRSSITKIDTFISQIESNKNKSTTEPSDQVKKPFALPKVDVNKRKELFEKSEASEDSSKLNKAAELTATKSIKERLSSLEKHKETSELSRSSVNVSINSGVKERLNSIEKLTSSNSSPRRTSEQVSSQSIKDRLSNFEKSKISPPKTQNVVEPTISIKDRLNSLHSSCEKEPVKTQVPSANSGFNEKLSTFNKESSDSSGYEERAFSPDDIYQKRDQHYRHRSLDSLDINPEDMSNGSFERVQSLEDLDYRNYPASTFSGDTDREDSGIHTADVSSSVSQADDYDHLDSNILDDVKMNHHPPIEEETKLVKTEIEKVEEQSKTVSDEDGSMAKSLTPDSSISETLPAIVENSSKSPLVLDIPHVNIPSPSPTWSNHGNTPDISETAAPPPSSSSSTVINVDKANIEENNKGSEGLSAEVTASQEVCSEKDGSPQLVSLHASISKTIEETSEIPSERLNCFNPPAGSQQSSSDPVPNYENIIPSPVPSSRQTSEKITSGFSEPPQFSSSLQPALELSSYEKCNFEINTPIVNQLSEIVLDRDMSDPSVLFPLASITRLEPPKEKPPPPPPLEASDEELDKTTTKSKSLRRLDSTKRIKKELRQKRSSFLGLEGNDDDSYLEPELELIRPPDMITLLAEERRVERQLYRQSVCSESDSNQESRDSGVELDHKQIEESCWSHSRNDSETFGNQSNTSDEDEIMKKEREIIETLEQEEKIRKQDLGEKLAMRLRELEAEKERWEQLQAQSLRNTQNQTFPLHNHASAENLNKCRSQEQLDSDWCSPSSSLQDISQLTHPGVLDFRAGEYRKSLGDLSSHRHQPNVRYAGHRRSMPNLQETALVTARRPPPPPPPVLPLKPPPPPGALQAAGVSRGGALQVPPPPPPPASALHHSPVYTQQRVHTAQIISPQGNNSVNGSGPMSRQTLAALSAAPRSRLISGDSWQVKKKQPRPADAYNYQHWLIQEAEHRRLTEQAERGGGSGGFRGRVGGVPQAPPQQWLAPPTVAGVGGPSATPHHPHQTGQQGVVSPPNQGWGEPVRGKHLPEAIIQTLTQRVQSRLCDPNNNRRRAEAPPEMRYQMPLSDSAKDKMLSVSGKKRCSHCGDELGRGAAMIIESLQLFYHIDCFKCCVCCIQLGDGLNGTDVRVRNNKLHCHNCYSSDDGAKFSCV